MAEEPYVHVPPDIKPEDFEVDRLKTLSYSREAITTAIRQYNGTSHCQIIPKRQEAIERFKYDMFSIWNTESQDDIQRLFNHLNSILFGGLLTGLCQIEIVASEDIFYKRNTRTISGMVGGSFTPFYPGEERDPRFRLEAPYCQIMLNKESHWANPLERLQNHITTLIHELLHAIFMLYECRCENGCKQKIDAAKKLGDCGHHESWLMAARTIESACEDFLGWPTLCLGRHQSLAAEIFEGRAYPTDEWLQRRYLRKVRVEKHLEDLKKKAASPKKDNPYMIVLELLKPSNHPVEWLKRNSCIRRDGTID